jgi:hypothetical protein
MEQTQTKNRIKLADVSKNIKNRTKVFVHGVVNFSHIASKISGEELDKANQYTQYPSKDPYYKLTVEVKGDANLPQPYMDAIEFNSKDISEATLAAYLYSRFYDSKKEEMAGKMFFSAQSKGNEVRVYQEDAEGQLHKVNLNGNELGECNVKLEMNYFESKFGPGVGLNSVIVTGPLKVFEGRNAVKGYENKIAEDTITLPARSVANVIEDDIAATTDETPVSDVASDTENKVEVENTPIGTTTQESNEYFDSILASFTSGQ